ncbi:MAG: SURF1 family protein [Gemmatimonadales bacterium]
MRTRAIIALAAPLAFAVLFARLGVWQLSRLRERRAFNATLVARLSAPPADIFALANDTAAGHYRRVFTSGTPLYDHQVVLGGRARDGAPGVDVLTPLAVPGRDTVVMIDRGFVPSADAATVDLARWREADSAMVAGFAETWSGSSAMPSAAAVQQNVVRALDRRAIERLVGRPVAPYLIVQLSEGAASSRRDSVPARRDLPVLSEGPHASYAGQWFSFAAIAVVGAFVLFRMQRADDRRRKQLG